MSVSPRSISSIRKTLASACSKSPLSFADAVVAVAAAEVGVAAGGAVAVEVAAAADAGDGVASARFHDLTDKREN